MRFEVTSGHIDANAIAAAMLPLDPAARITVDSAQSQLEVMSNASAKQVQGVLAELGCVVTPLESDMHISGGSTCCGGCS